ncbi:N-acetyl-gamma-glutamyl-phosphate reductase [Planctomycetes bacterium K23_9]|uniref:N-acetyl-gamma-glutamyl-phosphate reductase n=1 Tax=Stieleria marina TaxID=1930275 RepID=A0A517NUT4_9BACT|nr:N-acetyl-gamma-glutamyl-phosphate reductase [Planctomycetes bacterium K23_9]
MTIRVGIVGATGYTGLEAIRLLLSHPQAEVVVATSRADAGKPIAEVHPMLAGRLDLELTQLDASKIAQTCDVVMCCLPHGASAQTVKELVQHGTRVIDFSADFRLSNVPLYEKWYGVTHPWPERVGKTAYGMPEFFRDQIQDADVVANPGCYPTSAILPLAPLVQNGLIDASDVIVDSKTGVSGGGRSAKLAMLYCETNESIAAYGVGNHRHQPEIADLVQRISGTELDVTFTPHLAPMSRGILSTIYTKPNQASAKDVMQCWQDTYSDSVFVTPVDHLPATKHVAGTNFVQMTVREAGKRLILICAIDNLAKGASGAAVQNMNVMFDQPESTGLS